MEDIKYTVMTRLESEQRNMILVEIDDINEAIKQYLVKRDSKDKGKLLLQFSEVEVKGIESKTIVLKENTTPPQNFPLGEEIYLFSKSPKVASWENPNAQNSGYYRVRKYGDLAGLVKSNTPINLKTDKIAREVLITDVRIQAYNDREGDKR